MAGRDPPPPPRRVSPVREINLVHGGHGGPPDDEALRRIVRSAMAEVIGDLRDGLEERIRKAVTAEVAPILEHLQDERRDKEDYRRGRERREREDEVRVRKAEVELEKLETENIDRRIDGKHKRTVALLTALAVILSALAGLVGASLNSHSQSPPAPAAPH